MAMIARTGRGEGEARAATGAGPRLGLGLTGPGLIVFGLLAAALAYPVLEEPDAGAPRLEFPAGAMADDAAFSPGGTTLYVDHKALGPTIVDLDGGTLRRGPSAAGLSCTNLIVDPTGGSVVVALADGSMAVLDPKTLDPVRSLDGHEDRVMDLGVSADGRRLASIDDRGIVRIWDVGSGQLEREFRRDRALVCCDLSPDGRTVVLGDQQGRIEAITIDGGGDAGADSGAVLWVAHGPNQVVFGLSFSADGRTLASLGLDGSARIWDAGDGWAPRQEIRFPGNISVCLAIAPDGRTLATGHLDGRVLLWDAETGEQIEERRVDALQANSLGFSPDGRRLVVCSGGAVSLLDLSEAA